MKNSPACRDFDEMEDRQCKQDKDGVGEPWVQNGEVEPFRHMIGVEQLEDIEVEEIKTVAAFTNQEKRAPREDSRNRMGAAKTEHKRGEDGSHEAAMHEEIRCVANQGVEEDSDRSEAYS